MLNWIWLGLVILAVLLGGLSGQLNEVTAAAFDACKTAVMSLALPLAGIMAFWLGIMRLAEKSGLVELLAKALLPAMRRLFPDVPPTHPAMGSMVMNMAANMLGLGNAATPLGLRAMQHLEKLNPHPGIASNAMCTFLAINTSSIQLIPATAVAVLATNGAKDPTSIIGTAFMATSCAFIVAIVSVKTFEKLPFFSIPANADTKPIEAAEDEGSLVNPAPLGAVQKTILIAVVLFFAALFVGCVSFPTVFSSLANAIRHTLSIGSGAFAFDPDWIAKSPLQRAIKTISLLAIPFVLAMFPIYAAVRKVPVYEEFVEGAKEGFQVAIRIIPFLVAILVAIGMFRAAGGIQLLSSWLGVILNPLHFPPEILPLALMRPLSGGGSLAIFTDLVKTYHADSLIAQIGGTIMGSTETTFYVLAVYFGSVAIRRTRHAVAAGLMADVTGIVASVVVCNLFR